jgi:hypothetical protein
MTDQKSCTHCGERQPIDNFYFVSRKLGTRRGQCKACMSEIKQAQKDPDWRPRCTQCGEERDRCGPGRRLCYGCFGEKYDAENRRPGGSHRLKLKDCRSCGAKRLREDHEYGTMLCPVCRSVPQGRRKRLQQLYNLNPREYLALLAAQGYRCAICQKKPRSTLHLDHRHGDPMIVRGLLCPSCNTLLGAARDREAILRAAATYLETPIAQKVFPGRLAHPEANRKYNPLTRKRPLA